MEHLFQSDTAIVRKRRQILLSSKKGDLLYGKLRPYLDKCVIADFEGVCSTEILVYDVKSDFLKDIVLFICIRHHLLIMYQAEGTGQKCQEFLTTLFLNISFRCPQRRSRQRFL